MPLYALECPWMPLNTFKVSLGKALLGKGFPSWLAKYASLEESLIWAIWGIGKFRVVVPRSTRVWFFVWIRNSMFFMTQNRGFNKLMGQPRTAYRLKHVFDQRVIWRGAPCSFGAAPRAAISATPGAAGRGAPNSILRCQLFSLQMLLGATTNI